ncbi:MULTISPECIES: hypothetical protein [Protofrankia]|uniref:hypothetical protein n=1 Tax=Protofrankia TaxID=2994361 RepID=UPI0009784D9A|nr:MULTISPECIES: hypothetical protein [Protofrankia]
MPPPPHHGHDPDTPVTVWPCPPARQQEHGPAPSWLGAAVTRTAALYTQPGQTVLLLAPPAGNPVPMPGSRAGEDAAGRHPFDDLPQAAEALLRLGRRVRTRTASPIRRPPGHEENPTSPSGPGLDRHHAAGGRTGPGPADRGPDRADLLVTAVIPTASGWVHQVAWDALLTPTGILAVITHGDRRGGRFVDPTPLLVDTAWRAGLVLADRIVLVEIPLDSDHPTVDLSHGLLPPPLTGCGATRRVHSDLLLFTPAETCASSEKLRCSQPEPKCRCGSPSGLDAWVRGDSSGSVS